MIISSGLSQYSSVSLFAWSDFYTVVEKIFDGQTFYFSQDSCGVFCSCIPQVDQLTDSSVKEAWEWMCQINKSSSITRFDCVDWSQAQRLSYLGFESLPRSCEYVYWRQDLVELKGNGYKSKRHDVNLVKSRTGVVYREYSLEDFEVCLTLYDKWAEDRLAKCSDDVYQLMIEDSRTVHAKVLANTVELGVDARVVEVDGKIEGYTVGFALNPKVYCVYLEVVKSQIAGLPSFLFHNFCNDSALKTFSFVNCMDDFGMDNITKAKVSYRPALLLSSYTAVKKG